MLKILKKILRLMLSGVISLAVLSVFVYFYKYTSTRVITPNAPTDFTWAPEQAMNTMEEGFAWLEMDDNGYNNIHEKATGTQVDILLMGSSHLLGTEVAATENMGYVLNDLLPFRAYNIGMTGHYLSSCINNLKYAVKTFKPSWYVVIQTDSVSPTTEEMEQVLSGTYEEVESDSSQLFKLIQTYIPASKKIMVQVDAWREADNKKKKKESEIYDPSAYEDLLNRYLASASGCLGDNGPKLIILYTAPTKLDDDGNIIRYDNDTAVFAKACEKNNIIFIDMTDDYCEKFENEDILVHGFTNTAVGSGHLNTDGHLVTAQRLAQVIKEDIYK
ncbi:MAG: hypothetical protein K6E47_00765 [Lachnospiraceae bacterium]|nr:hypothetical protein [Lachnospiraceae bacterium]